MTFRQAIQTKYLGPTDRRGSRVKAWCEAGSITIGWDSASNSDFNHYNAALALLESLGWDKKNALIGGGLGNKGYCFVQVERLRNGKVRPWD